MKVSPASPSPAVQLTSQPSTDKRAAAIAAFEAASKQAAPPPQTQEHPVQNPSKISPEEALVVIPKSEQSLDKQAINEDTQKADETPKAPEKDPEVVKQFAEIARQERILRAKAQKQQQELADQRAALDAEKAALATKAKEYEEGYIPKSRLKLDTAGVLESELGNDWYDQVTQRVMAPNTRNPVVDAELQALRDEVKALRSGLDETKQSNAKSQADAYQQAINQLKNDASKLVKGNPDFEAIDKTEAIQDVVDLIEQVYKKDGIVMSVQEAAQEVENYLVEESFSTVTRIDKIKKRLAEEAARSAPKPTVTQEATNAKPEETQAAKTLTNNMSTTRKLSARERAIAAMEGRLK